MPMAEKFGEILRQDIPEYSSNIIVLPSMRPLLKS